MRGVFEIVPITGGTADILWAGSRDAKCLKQRAKQLRQGRTVLPGAPVAPPPYPRVKRQLWAGPLRPFSFLPLQLLDTRGRQATPRTLLQEGQSHPRQASWRMDETRRLFSLALFRIPTSSF